MHRNRNGRAIMVSAIAAIVAGCASSNFKLASQQRTSLQSVTDDRVANAPLETSPKILPETHVAAGRMFEAQRDTSQAIQQYRKAVAVNHRNVVAHQRLGYLLGQVGEHAEAIEVLGRAVTLDPSNAVLRNNLGFELMHVQRWKEAEAELRTAIRLQPGFARAHVNLAMVLCQTSRFDEALAEFERVLPDADAHYNMGLLHRGQKRYSEAQASFERVLRINPAFTAARKQLAEVAPFAAAEVATAERGAGFAARSTDVDGRDEAVNSAPGFTVQARVLDGGDIGIVDTDAAEFATNSATPSVAPFENRVARIENKIDAEDDGDRYAAIEGPEYDLDRADDGDSDDTSTAAVGDSETTDWTIPFGLSLARRLSEVRAEGNAIEAEHKQAVAGTKSVVVANADDEEPSPRPSPLKGEGEVVAAVRDPATQSWVDDLRMLDSRLTVVRNQIACLDEEIARNEAELVAARSGDAADSPLTEVAWAADETQQASVTIDETGVYARVLGASGTYEIETGDTYAAPAIADFSPADPIASEVVPWSIPEDEDSIRIAPFERRIPAAVPVKYQEPATKPARTGPSNQGTFLWSPSLDEASSVLAMARNEIRCREAGGTDPEFDEVESWDEIVSWFEWEPEQTWCDFVEVVPMCDPRWDDGDGETVKGSQTSMNFVRPSDPRRVRPMPD